MAAWALAVLQGLTPELWAAALSFLAACPQDSWDEVRRAGGRGFAAGQPAIAAASLEPSPAPAPPQVALVHLYQAAMFVPRSAVTAHVPGPAGRLGNAAMPPMRSAAGGWCCCAAAACCCVPLPLQPLRCSRACLLTRAVLPRRRGAGDAGGGRLPAAAGRARGAGVPRRVPPGRL